MLKTHVPCLPKDVVVARAGQMLDQFNRKNEFPLPIEEIIEYELNIEIRPVSDLLVLCGQEGFLSRDLRTIFVDKHRQTHQPHRYRFTLAHEAGHLFLHPEYVQQLSVNSPEFWKEAVQNIEPQARALAESQANLFAACVLVPRARLQQEWEEGKQIAARQGLIVDQLGTYGIELVAEWVAKRFDVSMQMLMFRLSDESVI